MENQTKRYRQCNNKNIGIPNDGVGIFFFVPIYYVYLKKNKWGNANRTLHTNCEPKNSVTKNGKAKEKKDTEKTLNQMK